MRFIHSSGLATFLALLASCGSAGSQASLSFTAAPLATVDGSSGRVSVAIRSSPQPPERGLTNFQYAVTGSDGQPVDGLQIRVQPWMPAMGHGTSVVPTVKGTGGGTYLITDVYLYMPGLWELRTTITGGVTDSVDPQFQIN